VSAEFEGSFAVEDPPFLSEERNTESPIQALIKLEVACRLALDSVVVLPPESEKALREPIEKLCELTQRELTRLDPEYAPNRLS
jgi:hypothetical protein